MESQRNQRLKSSRLILQLAQPAQVIDAVPWPFRCGRRASWRWSAAPGDVPRDGCRTNGGVGLVLADLVADLGMENLGPAAGQASQARFDQLFEHPADRFLVSS